MITTWRRACRLEDLYNWQTWKSTIKSKAWFFVIWRTPSCKEIVCLKQVFVSFVKLCIYKLQLGLFEWNSMKSLHACKKEICHGKFRSFVSSQVHVILCKGGKWRMRLYSLVSVRHDCTSGPNKLTLSSVDYFISISFLCCFVNPFRLRISALHGSERFPQADQPDQTTFFLFYKSAANFLSTSRTINIQDAIVSFLSSRSGSFIMGWVKGG